MAYSLDLKTRIVNYVENGGSVAKAARIFQVGRASIYRWLDSEDLEPKKVTRRNRKLDWEALDKEIKINPDVRLIDRARQFGVRPSAISYALKKMKITRKKNNFVITKETEKKECSTTDDCGN